MADPRRGVVRLRFHPVVGPDGGRQRLAGFGGAAGSELGHGQRQPRTGAVREEYRRLFKQGRLAEAAPDDTLADYGTDVLLKRPGRHQDRGERAGHRARQAPPGGRRIDAETFVLAAGIVITTCCGVSAPPNDAGSPPAAPMKSLLTPGSGNARVSLSAKSSCGPKFSARRLFKPITPRPSPSSLRSCAESRHRIEMQSADSCARPAGSCADGDHAGRVPGDGGQGASRVRRGSSTVEIAVQGTRVLRAEFAPKVIADGTLFDFQQQHNNGEVDFRLGFIRLEWMLFEGGRKIAAARVAQAQVRGRWRTRNPSPIRSPSR